MSKYYVDAYMEADDHGGISVSREDFMASASVFNVDNEEFDAIEKILRYMKDLDNDEYIVITKQVW